MSRQFDYEFLTRVSGLSEPLDRARMICDRFFEMDSSFRDDAEKAENFEHYVDGMAMISLECEKLGLDSRFSGINPLHKEGPTASVPSITRFFVEVREMISRETNPLQLKDMSSTQWFEAPPDVEEWESLEAGSGCALDFIASAAILEFLAEQKAISIDEKPDYRFQRYRRFSRLVDAKKLIHQLVIFDKIYLNIGWFYKQHMDLSVLKSLGFFEEYPRPPVSGFLDSYRLIKPLALRGIIGAFRKVVQVPYEMIWIDGEAKTAFGNYEGFLGWLYDQYAKDACGLESQELGLINRVKEKYVGTIWDFMEFAVQAQGFFAAGDLPMFSSILRAGADLSSHCHAIPESVVRDNTFALYQIASKDVLGHFVALDSFSDVLRLRDDRHVTKLRKLLKCYLVALDKSDEQVVREISGEIAKAKEHLDHPMIRFVEQDWFTLIVKPITYFPVVGTVVNIVADAIDLWKMWREKEHGWVYFGLK